MLKIQIKPPGGCTLLDAKHFWGVHCKRDMPEDVKELFNGFPFEDLKEDSPLNVFLKINK